VNPENVARMIEAVQQYGELLGGMRNQLIAQGFSIEIAEQMVFEILKKAA
jgi:hypothetical protein